MTYTAKHYQLDGAQKKQLKNGTLFDRNWSTARRVSAR
jgi:hypothetical protein